VQYEKGEQKKVETNRQKYSKTVKKFSGKRKVICLDEPMRKCKFGIAKINQYLNP
jgi:hypothetical protein